MDGLYCFVSTEARGHCPVCHELLPTRGAPRSMAVQTGPLQTSVNTRCFLRVCQCGLALAVQPVDAGFRYAFRCRVCDCYSPDLSGSGWCLLCTLERRVGIGNAAALLETLKESDVCMGATRSEFLDGFLKGVLLGVPGLVVPEPV